jgi:hypothetical protein
MSRLQALPLRADAAPRRRALAMQRWLRDAVVSGFGGALP